MSADSPDDWEADEVEPSPDASRPGLDAVAGRAFGELVAENAELYRRIDTLEKQLKLRDDRFYAWAREFAWHEETMKSSIERQDHAITELRSALDGDGPPNRLEERQPAQGETDTPERVRSKTFNEYIATGAAIGGLAFTVIGDAIGSTVATDTAGIAGGVLTTFAAGIALARKRNEVRRDDRPQG